MTKPVFDILGNEIKVGDFIAYGVRCGNSGDLRVGKVITIEVNVLPPFPNGWLQTDYKIKVVGIDVEYTSGIIGQGTNKKWRVCKPGNLNTPSRIIVLSRSGIPKEALTVLDTI